MFAASSHSAFSPLIRKTVFAGRCNHHIKLPPLVVVDELKHVNDFHDNNSPTPTVIHDVEQQVYASAGRFEDLGVSVEIQKGLYTEMKFERPRKIQLDSARMTLNPPYDNLIVHAPIGSGKSTGAMLVMLGRVDPTLAAPQAICICPTREAAFQNMEMFLKMGKFTGITSELAAFPADRANYTPVSKREPATAQVIIGTPSTINKWIASKKMDTSSLKILVFDDADHMLAEGGLKEDSVRIMKEIRIMKETVEGSPKCQVLLFSATFNDTVKAFALKIVEDYFVQGYNQLFIEKEELSLDSVKQYKVNVPDELTKIVVIKDFIMDLGDKIGQTIIFVKTTKSATAGMLHEALVKYGYEVITLHGALTQEDRDKMLKFKDGLSHVLISNDVFTRGFYQSKVNLVVNYDLPVVYDNPYEPDNEVYLHRVARAGQFGRKGAIFNLLCGDEDNKIMNKIENHINHNVIEVPSWKSDEDYKDALKKAGLMQNFHISSST